jgi:serine/threonine protein kinase
VINDTVVEVKICDFGIAQDISKIKHLKTGTPGYTAPEILKD